MAYSILKMETNIGDNTKTVNSMEKDFINGQTTVFMREYL